MTKRVNLMAYTPSSPMVSSSGPMQLNILTGVASREVDLRKSETASVDLALRDVVVASRVTRGGQPAPGLRVFLRSASGGSVFAFAGPTAPGAVLAAAGPPPLTAVTRDDGVYEMLAFTPGPALVDLSSAMGSQRYPGREVTVPDAERFELDLEVADTMVSGIVVDSESGEPVADANAYPQVKSIGGQRVSMPGMVSGPTDWNGAFELSAPAGVVDVEARKDAQRGRGTVTVRAGETAPLVLHLQ